MNNPALLANFANARKEAEERKAQLKAMIDAVLDSEEYKELEINRKTAEQIANELREEIEREAVKDFYETGEKKHFDGAVTVQERKSVKVNEDAEYVRKWVGENLPGVLSVDLSLLKKAAKVPGIVPETIVKTNTVTKIAIARDLSKWETE